MAGDVLVRTGLGDDRTAPVHKVEEELGLAEGLATEAPVADASGD